MQGRSELKENVVRIDMASLGKAKANLSLSEPQRIGDLTLRRSVSQFLSLSERIDIPWLQGYALSLPEYTSRTVTAISMQ